MKHNNNNWNEWKTTVYLSILLIIIGWLVLTLRGDIPTLMVLLMGSPLIALGVWFIRGPKKAQVEDIPAFTPPEAETAQEEPTEGDAQKVEATENTQEDSHGDE